MAERRSPIHDYHLRHAGQLIKGGGDYMFPLSYTSGLEEHVNTRTNVGMQDISSMGEVDVEASDSLGKKLIKDNNWNRVVAISALLFIMFYAPCFVTVVCIAKEASWKWAFFSIAFNMFTFMRRC